MARKTLIVANWKMHLNVHESSLLVHRLSERVKAHRNLEIVLAPSMLSLQPISVQLDRRKFRLSAQDGYFEDEGPLTGEVSFAMMRDLIHYSIVGHSSRRLYAHETLEVVRNKVQAAVRNEIIPILCVGETQHERNMGETRQVVHDQVTTALSNLTPEEVEKIVIAYEPVWAIGTGDPEKPDSIMRTINYIRLQIRELYGTQAAEAVRILYGASVAPEFVGAILGLEGVDGLLVGGASLNYHQFSDIIDRAHRLVTEREKS